MLVLREEGARHKLSQADLMLSRIVDHMRRRIMGKARNGLQHCIMRSSSVTGRKENLVVIASGRMKEIHLVY